MKRHQGRMVLERDAVLHAGEGKSYKEKCLFCDKRSRHKVKGRMPLCTYHFSRLFASARTRFPKQKTVPIKVETPGADGYKVYTIKRHMEEPLVFTGKRVLCSELKTKYGCVDETWYISVYHIGAGGGYVVSVTRVFHEIKKAIHVATEINDLPGQVLAEVLRQMMGRHELICPYEEFKLSLQMEVTDLLAKWCGTEIEEEGPTYALIED